MTYATLAIIASLLEKEKNIREKECELLREKLNSARDQETAHKPLPLGMG